MPVYVVKIGFGVRRHGMATPVDGPCSPPYLRHDAHTRYVAVEAENHIEAELAAFEMAEALTHVGNQVLKSTDPMPNVIMVGADMVTTLRTVEAVL